MKKVLGFMMVLALASGVVACDGDNGGDEDVIINPDAKTDAKTDLGPVTDVPKDQISGTDTPDNNLPVDPGQQQDTPDTFVPPVDNGTDQGPPPVGCTPACTEDPVGSCQVFFDCQAECPQDASGQACVSECQGKLSTDGLADYQAFRTCLTQYCANAATNEEFGQCIDQYCLDSYYGCFWGCDYCECSDLVKCLNSCPDDNPATASVNEQVVCIGDCWGNGTTAAQMDLQAYIDCAQNACPVCDVANPTPAQEEECNTCWNNASDTTCAAAWEKCVSYGTATCAQTVQCLNGCGETDQACVQECAGNMSKVASEQINAVYDCLAEACPEGSATTCYSDAQKEGGACYDEITTCIGEPTYGTATCGATVTCMNDCGTNQSCAQTCVNQASEVGFNKLQAVFECLDTACPEGSAETCYDDAQKEGGACFTQIQACINDAG